MDEPIGDGPMAINLTTDERSVLAWFATQPEAVDLASMFNAMAPRPSTDSEVRNRKRRLTALDDVATHLYRAGLTRVARLGNGLNRTTLWEITAAGREALAAAVSPITNAPVQGV